MICLSTYGARQIELGGDAGQLGWNQFPAVVELPDLHIVPECGTPAFPGVVIPVVRLRALRRLPPVMAEAAHFVKERQAFRLAPPMVRRA